MQKYGGSAMRISVRQSSPTEVATPLLGVAIYEDASQLTREAGAVDAALGGLIGQLIADKEISGKPNELTLIHTQGQGQGTMPARRIAVLGLGKRGDFGLDAVRQVAAIIAVKARDLHLSGCAVVLPGDGGPGASAEQL